MVIVDLFCNWYVSTHKVGRLLINLNYEQQKYEADFRFAMMRVRENTESIAFIVVKSLN